MWWTALSKSKCDVWLDYHDNPLQPLPAHTKHNANLKNKKDKRRKQETDGQLKVKENKEDSGYVDIATNLWDLLSMAKQVLENAPKEIEKCCIQIH